MVITFGGAGFISKAQEWCRNQRTEADGQTKFTVACGGSALQETLNAVPPLDRTAQPVTRSAKAGKRVRL